MDRVGAVRGLSVVEDMAAENHEFLIQHEDPRIPWEDLAPEVRQHLWRQWWRQSNRSKSNLASASLTSLRCVCRSVNVLETVTAR